MARRACGTPDGAGRDAGGLGARDTLRLEVCFHLYGNDLSEDRNLIEAGLHGAASSRPASSGRMPWRGSSRRTRSCRSPSPAPASRGQDNPVHTATGDGVVTSGSLSPCLEVGIGMAYVPVAAAAPGTKLEVDVRGKSREAEVREKPLYRKETSG